MIGSKLSGMTSHAWSLKSWIKIAAIKLPLLFRAHLFAFDSQEKEVYEQCKLDLLRENLFIYKQVTLWMNLLFPKYCSYSEKILPACRFGQNPWILSAALPHRNSFTTGFPELCSTQERRLNPPSFPSRSKVELGARVERRLDRWASRYSLHSRHRTVNI